MGKNTNEINPITQSTLFGEIPALTSGKIIFDAGPIYLKHGVHRRGSGGYGIEHILGRHRTELISHGVATSCDEVSDKNIRREIMYEQVASYVASIIVAKAALFSDFELPSLNKIQINKRGVGVAVVQPKEDGAGNLYYSVVTAYPGQAKGSKIGALA